MKDPASPATIAVDWPTRVLIAEWAHHLDAKPDIPPDYAANIDHLRIQVDRWTTTEAALRTVICDHLATIAMNAYRTQEARHD